MIDKFKRIFVYVIPLMLYIYGITKLTDNNLILLITFAVEILMLYLMFFELLLNKTEKILNINKLKFVSLLINLLFIYTLFSYSIYLGWFVVFMIVSILLHETGHLFFALKGGVKASEFSIGFGEEIFGFDYKGIRFKFCNILFGGYVKFIDDDILKEGKKKLIDYEKKDELYIYKDIWTKLKILLGGVLMNLLLSFVFLYTAINIVGFNFKYDKIDEQYIQKIKKQEKENEGIEKYLISKIGKDTVWFGANKNEFSFNETINGIKIVIYSLKYSIENPEYFLKFQSVVGVGRDIGIQDKAGIMNRAILFLILSLLNISLFVVNLLPIPALDGGQIFKELIFSIVKEKEKRAQLLLSKSVNLLEYVGFFGLTGFGLILLIKDIFLA